MDEPLLRVWMEEYLPPAPFYEERPGRWVAEESWPSPRITPRRFYLNVLSLGERADPEDRMRIRSLQPTGLAAGDWYGFGAEGESPTDQREDDGKSLVFDSDPLLERLEILGAPVVELELSVDRPVAFVAVRLNDVAPDGASSRVTYGLLNLTQREDREHPTPLEPGRRYRVAVKLNDIAYAFAPGHTVRVAVSTCYWPMAWPAPEAVQLTVYTGSSHIDLPQRPPRPDDLELPPFQPPECGPGPRVTPLQPAPMRRTVERDLITGTTVYHVSSDGGLAGAARARFEEIGLTVGYSIAKTYRIHDHDPDRAHAIIEQQTLLEGADWSTRVELRTEVTADRESFSLSARLDAYEGGAPFATREWTEVIPRQLV